MTLTADIGVLGILKINLYIDGEKANIQLFHKKYFNLIAGLSYFLLIDLAVL